ncbi:hypothetical protein H0H92_001940 [Tricholoma furcatifolium]|nr:hypothetical protein H0H92_001940 [Tricholoma furcatifolium]
MNSDPNYPEGYPRLSPQHQHRAGFPGQSLPHYADYHGQQMMVPFYTGRVQTFAQGCAHQGVCQGYHHNSYNPYAPRNPFIVYPPVSHAHDPPYMIQHGVRYNSTYTPQSRVLYPTSAAQRAPLAPTVTPEQLLPLSPEDRKLMLGEAIYPRVSAEQPDRAEKITGMLLQMDNDELLHLLDDPDAMTTKIREAMAIL